MEGVQWSEAIWRDGEFSWTPPFFQENFLKRPLEKFLRIQLPCCIYLEGCPILNLYISKTNCDHTTRQSENLEGNVKNSKNKWSESIWIGGRICRIPPFFQENFLKSPLEKFLHIQLPYCRYLEDCSKLDLYNSKKIMIISFVRNWESFPNYNLEHEGIIVMEKYGIRLSQGPTKRQIETMMDGSNWSPSKVFLAQFINLKSDFIQ